LTVKRVRRSPGIRLGPGFWLARLGDIFGPRNGLTIKAALAFELVVRDSDLDNMILIKFIMVISCDWLKLLRQQDLKYVGRQISQFFLYLDHAAAAARRLQMSSCVACTSPLCAVIIARI